MRLEEALSGLEAICLGAGGGVSALTDYLKLAEQAAVLKELLPGQEQEPALMKRARSGLRMLEEVLLKKLQTMIPLHEAVLDSIDTEDASPLEDIPFQSWFPHGDENLSEYMDELPEGERLAAILSWGGTPEQVADAFGLDTVPKFTLPKYEQLLERLEGQREPIKFLADVFRVINKDSGCYWWDGLCDCGGGCGHGLPWNVRDITLIANQRKEAESIGKRLVSLSKWIHRDPKARVARLLQIIGGGA